MKKALAITTQGEVSTLDLSDSALEKLQGAVGGYVQAIDLCIDPTISMWCNEEGKMVGLPHNPFGQAFWEMAFPVSEYGKTDYIVGDIVITGGVDSEGETLGLSDYEIEMSLKVVATVLAFISPKVEIF